MLEHLASFFPHCFRLLIKQTQKETPYLWFGCFFPVRRKWFEITMVNLSLIKHILLAGHHISHAFICIVVRVRWKCCMWVHPAFQLFGLHLLRAWVDRRRRQTQTIAHMHIYAVCTHALVLSLSFSRSFAQSFCVQLCIMYMQNFNFRSFAVKWLHRWKSNRHRATISKKEKDRDGGRERKKNTFMNRVKSSDFVCIEYKIMRASWFF